MKDDSTTFATFEMPVNIDIFTELFRVQQGPYTRKLGILGGVLCSIMTLFAILNFLAEPGIKSLGIAVIFTTLVALSVAMVRDPAFMLRFRGKQIVLWLYLHGADPSSDIALGDISTTCRVTLGNLGYTVESANGSFNVAWSLLDQRERSCPSGVCHRFDDGRNSSLLYNLIGANALLRKEDAVNSALFLPTAVLEENPGLGDRVTQKTIDARKMYARRGPATEEQREHLANWMDSETMTKEAAEARGA